MSEKPLIQIWHGADKMPLINIKAGSWVFDMGTSEVNENQYTGGIFIKDEFAVDLKNDSFPGNEWKYILEGEWHMIQNGEKLVAKPGDVVFLPKGTAFQSLKNPFKAFFVTNRGAQEHKPYK
ncbi:hypothetical protein IAR55_000002 [Kwoniella newhampshirensis]|uniref:(S)-ureidoglycine aminohydrolase cupin domain-containing protein n=1 Tax=Kwoniella newhampshirensis TaxID=1651941 RepID=A0AAW0Z5G6_9TREE